MMLHVLTVSSQDQADDPLVQSQVCMGNRGLHHDEGSGDEGGFALIEKQRKYRGGGHQQYCFKRMSCVPVDGAQLLIGMVRSMSKHAP